MKRCACILLEKPICFERLQNNVNLYDIGNNSTMFCSFFGGAGMITKNSSNSSYRHKSVDLLQRLCGECANARSQLDYKADFVGKGIYCSVWEKTVAKANLLMVLEISDRRNQFPWQEHGNCTRKCLEHDLIDEMVPKHVVYFFQMICLLNF